ncbi:MAG: hypothetical protein JO235_08025 [Chroococcidiopsidaceae cyanobacterium CP_BM_RX_35]|nr:hypothetical protein [Chroococcidiopsidaceae cyanobacterium CP_BM_RX_35]
MFVDELTPIFKQLTRHPVSFLGGFCSGLLRLNLTDEPVKNWLDQQVGPNTSTPFGNQPYNGSASGPQSISIE